MAKKKRKLTPNQIEYQRQVKLLKRRIKSWERKGYLFEVRIPEMVKRVTKKNIQELKSIQFKNFTKEERDIAWGRYQIRLELSREPEINYDDYWYEPEYRPVNTMDEIQQWIDDIINEILNPDLLERDREGAKELLETIIDNARQRLGDKGFYDYLQDPEVVTKLKNAASNYRQSYRKKNGTDTGDESLREFTETLNLGRPLTQEQAEDLERYGVVGFDYSDTKYD